MRQLKSLLRLFIATLLLGAFASSTMGQWSNALEPTSLTHERATEAYAHRQYALALHLFETLKEQATSPTSDLYVEASYYSALSALALYHKDAVYKVNNFVKQFPESPLAIEAKWELANFHYKRRNYSKAAAAFQDIRVRALDAPRRDEYRFKLGHCHFEREEYELARVPLYEVLDVEGPFQSAAQYYFSHIAYLNDQPQVALDGFEKIADDPNFSELVPLYITQLLHLTGQFDRLKSYAPPLLDASSGLDEDAVTEVAHLLGDAWYRDDNFEEALPYLELAWEGSDGPARNAEFAYQMGYTRYRNGDWRGALDCLPLATYGDDPLAQNAAYHMADCYLQMGDRARAKTAFKTASVPEFDLEIKEDAFFQYAKLSYELSFNPFDDAIVTFETYLDQYPASPRRDEAYRFLLQVHMTSRNYERALAALAKIGDTDETVRAAAQVLAFNRAVELFQNRDWDRALTFFRQSRSNNVDPKLHAETWYWEAEILFLQEKFARAASAYEKFSTTPGSYLSPLHNDADYSRGYAQYKDGKYQEALTAFRSYLETNPDDDPARMRDAELRAADCFYAVKSFDQAAEYYDRVLARGVNPLDYALFQRGMSAKLDNDPSVQLTFMDQLLSEHPNSRLVVEALYQSARTRIELGDLDNAERQLTSLIDGYSATPRAKQALVELCLVGVKRGQDDKVIALWDRIRNEYGNDNVAADAYNIVEPLLIERGLLGDLPAAVGLDADDIEQRVFQSASIPALEGRCDEAVTRLSDYIEAYPAGLHIAEVQHYLGNCLFDQGDTEAAYEAFVAVLALPAGEFTESAALGAATVAWNAKRYAEALSHYEMLESVSVLQSSRLEAAIGQMRCHYLLGEENEALEFASRVLQDEGTPADIRRTAQLWNARIACNQGRHGDVLADLESLVTFGGNAGAEAQYLLAEHAYRSGEFEPCESRLFFLIETFYHHDEWKNKGFLLLVQTYIAMNDLFQARATAESILANVQVPEIQEAVSDLLLEIDALESTPDPAAPGMSEDSDDSEGTSNDTNEESPSEEPNPDEVDGSTPTPEKEDE